MLKGQHLKINGNLIWLYLCPIEKYGKEGYPEN